jgi:hypothetical protein
MDTKAIEPEWLKTTDAAKIASVSRPTIANWIHRGRIKAFVHRERGQIRATVLVSLSSLRAFLDRHSSGGCEGEASADAAVTEGGRQ